MQPDSSAPATSGGEPVPAMDPSEAMLAIDTLTGVADKPITFQTFPEGEGKGQPQHFHGTLLECWPRIERLNAEGQGIFLMVQEGDGTGRKAENVTALRSIFADDDSGALDPATLAVLPSLVVESSPGKGHYYWNLEPGEALADFTPAQAAIAAKLGTDPAVKDLPRVLRLPGTIHRKDPSRPHLVRVLSANPERRYSIKGALAGLGATLAAPVAPPAPPTPSPAPTPTALASRVLTGGGADPKARARAWMLAAPAAGQGERDSKCYSMACNLVLGFALADGDAADIGREYGARCSPPAADLWESKWIPNAKRSGSEPVGGLLNAAMPDAPRLSAPTASHKADPEEVAEGLASRLVSLSPEEVMADPEPKRFIWEHRIPEGDAGVLAGAGAGGKTSLLVGLAVHRAIGMPFLGKPVKQGTTLILSTEDGIQDYRRKLAAWRGHLSFNFNAAAVSRHIRFIDLAGVPFKMIEGRFGEYSPSGQVAALAQVLRSRVPEADLIVLETVSRLGGDESNPAMSAMVVAAEQLAKATGAAVVLVTHVAKAAARGGVGDAYAPRGGGAITDNGRFTLTLAGLGGVPEKQAEAILGFKPTADELKTLLLLAVPKINSAPSQDPVKLERLAAPPWGITLRLFDEGVRTGEQKEAARAAERSDMARRLGELVAHLTSQGFQVTLTSLKDSHRTVLGLSQRGVEPAVALAIQEGFVAWGDSRKGGRTLVAGPRLPAPPSSPDPLDHGGTAGGAMDKDVHHPRFSIGGDCHSAPVQGGLLGGREVGDA